MKLFVLKWLRQQCRSLINKPRWQRCCKEFPWSCIPSRFCTAAPATKNPPRPLHWRSFRWSSPHTSSIFWSHRLRTESPASVWKYWKKINKRESLIFAYETLFEFLKELWVRSTKTCRFERIFRSTCHCYNLKVVLDWLRSAESFQLSITKQFAQIDGFDRRQKIIYYTTGISRIQLSGSGLNAEETCHFVLRWIY